MCEYSLPDLVPSSMKAQSSSFIDLSVSLSLPSPLSSLSFSLVPRMMMKLLTFSFYKESYAKLSNTHPPRIL